MFGVGTYAPQPKALKAMLDVLESDLPTVPVHPDVPKSYPPQFVVVQKTGGVESANGRIINPQFAIQCYASDIGSAETLAGLVISVLKSTQYRTRGSVQFRKFDANEAVPFNNPAVPGRQRWQFFCTFAMSNA